MNLLKYYKKLNESIKKIFSEKYFEFSFKLSKNKYLEIEITFFNNDAWNIYNIEYNWSIKGDHCGIKFIFELYKLINFNLNIYDHRHWDWESNTFINNNEKVLINTITKCSSCEIELSKKWHFMNGNIYCQTCLPKKLDETINEKIITK